MVLSQKRRYSAGMNDVQAMLMKLMDKGWTMAAIADEMEVSHMTVFRWQNGLRSARNSRSVLYMLESLLHRKRIPKRKRRGSGSSLRNISSGDRNQP